jgi:hypothetical protein
VEVPPPTPPARPDEHDNRIYSWVEGDGAVHYGTVDDVPANLRKSARVVDSGVTVVSTEPLEALPPAAARAALSSDQPGDQHSERKPPGAQPELDENGLPVPGTMQDTAAIRASRAAGETQLDPAAVERRREEDLRRMNCKQKDGAWICG